MSTVHDFKSAATAGHLHIKRIAATALIRLTRFPKTEPYWGKGKAYRFDDPDQLYGATYTAPALDIAFAETILHQKGLFLRGRWVIDRATINERHIVTYERPWKPQLRVADLTGTHLKALGLNNDLCSSDDYADSMAVSSALHDQLPELDGIQYVSRQLNTGFAVALFERSAVRIASNVFPLPEHPDYPALIHTFNVDVIGSGRPPA